METSYDQKRMGRKLSPKKASRQEGNGQLERLIQVTGEGQQTGVPIRI